MEGTAQINSALWIGTSIMLILAFGLIFLALFYQNYFARMKRKEAEQLLMVSLESEKNERKRIAADLHDSVSGDLVAIRNYLSILKKSGANVDSSIFDELREGVENALQNTRQVSYKLMPPLLDTFGLAAAVNDYFERLAQKTGVEFAVDGDGPKLSDEVAYEMFRVVQEFVTNMLKYGNATRCKVAIYSEPGIKVEIEDDGVPFDFKAALAASGGAGLRNIAARLRVIGAELSQPDRSHGNHFVITLKQQAC